MALADGKSTLCRTPGTKTFMSPVITPTPEGAIMEVVATMTITTTDMGVPAKVMAAGTDMAETN